MKLLALDTSTELATVSLLSNDVFYSEKQDSMRQHAQFLLPMIENVLTQANIELSQLDGIIFGCGPGSFTGLRITCSIAKALAYAHNLPLFPVSSLHAIAFSACHDMAFETPILTLIDARMHQVYWQYFNNGSKTLEQVNCPEDIRLPETPFIAAGVGFESYIPRLSSALQAQIVEQKIIYPQAEAMINLVLNNKIRPVSVHEALPLYVRNQVTQGEPRG